MPRAYCDHNFLINTFGETPPYQTRLRNSIEQRRIELVLSTWHWEEMARDANEARSLGLADYADSLQPLWLRERRNLQTNEVADALFRFIGAEYQIPPPFAALPEVVAAMVGVEPQIAANYTRSAPFVRHLRTPQGAAPLREAYDQVYRAQEFVRQAHRNQNFSRPIRRTVDRTLVQQLLPDRTPTGEKIDRRLKRKFLSQIRVNQLPSLAVEVALSDDARQLNRALPEREFRDRQHAIAIPYVDFLITDDGRLTNTIGRIAQRLTFPTATVINKTEFERRFM